MNSNSVLNRSPYRVTSTGCLLMFFYPIGYISLQKITLREAVNECHTKLALYKNWERVLCEVSVEAEERVESITQHSAHGWHQN